MNDPFKAAHRSWPAKFQAAFRGGWLALRGQSSFWVHGVFAAGVLLAAAIRQFSTWRWCVLLLCITTVLVAEMLNTALEHLAQAVDPKFNPHIRDTLDIGSAAVLLAALGAIALGAIVFLS